jgi:NADPH2:quinone reductase
MVMAIRIHETGGTDVLRWEEVEVGDPGPGEARLRQTAVGLNFIDTYHRTGLYPMPFPAILGVEAAGVVEAIGENVTDVAIGDRVAYTEMPPGAYTQARIMPADRLVKLPDSMDDLTAGAGMLKGLTAQFLLRRTYAVQPGDTILVHAAAGGVGLIMCQWAKHLGATVIGTVSSDEKAELARAHGCDHPIIYTRDKFAEKVNEITGGAGLPVVYDSVGKDTFMDSLDCLRPLGMMVTYGNASGPPPDINPLLLAQKGSLFLTRPVLMAYNQERAALTAAAQDLFSVLDKGVVKVDVRQTYALKDAAQAQDDLVARKTTGSSVLVP